MAEALTPLNLGGLRIQTVQQKQNYLNMLVYGDPGEGKTVLAGSADEVPEMRPVLIVDVEGGTRSISERNPEVHVVRVLTWKELQKVYDELQSGRTDYRTVVLDSLTEIQKFSMYQIMEDLVRKEPERDPDIPSVREWGKNIEQIRRLVRGFRDLEMNVIFTALAKGDRNPKTGVTKNKPYLSGKLADEVAGFLDIVGYLYSKVDAVNGEEKTVRRLLTQKTEEYVAKDRTARLPTPVVEEPTMKKLYEYILAP